MLQIGDPDCQVTNDSFNKIINKLQTTDKLLKIIN